MLIYPKYGTFPMSDNGVRERGPFDWAPVKTICCLSWILIPIIGVFLLCFLTPSFKYVHYDQVALEKSITGVVNYNKVYTQGRHYLMLGKSLIKFPATQQRVAFLRSEGSALKVFSEQGLEFDINVVFYYKLNVSGLGWIYKEFGTNYGDRMDKISQSLLKDLATNYSSDQFIRNRTQIAQDFATTLRTNLETSMNVLIDPALVILLDITFPDTLNQKNLETAVELQNNILQQNQQNVDLIVAKTDVMVTEINAESNYTLANAYIQANQTINNAYSYSSGLQLKAQSDGIQEAISRLDLSPEDTLFLLKTVALMNSQGTKILYGVDNAVKLI